jgi:excisionase family DNA binding protein
MLSINSQNSLVVINNHISVKTAAEYSGYSQQYLRRLLRNSKLTGIKIGQTWLIDKAALEIYLQKVSDAVDRRFGPH